MATKTKPFDPSKHLDDDEAIAFYIDEALATNDAAVVAACLGDVARARGMTQLAKEAGLTRASLYKALSAGGNPEFATILRVIQALRLKLSAVSSAADAV
jgi:probable addiction module antidote protein